MSKNKLLVIAAAVVVAIMTGIIAGVVSTDSIILFFLNNS